MKDFQVTSSLVQLKALVAGLYGRIDALAAAPAPTVDFAVDMFDRQDQDTLGPYWSNSTSYSIRSGVVVLGVGATSVSDIVAGSTYMQCADFYLSVHATEEGYGISSSIVEAIYQADIADNNFQCRVQSIAMDTQPGDSYSKTISGICGVPYTCAGQTVTVTVNSSFSSYATVVSNAGVCVANSSNAAEGLTASIFRAQQLNVSASSNLCGSESASYGDNGMLAKVRYGNNVTSRAILPESPADGVISAAYGIGASGINIFSAACTGATVSMSLNGVLVFSGKQTTVAQKGRSRAGIMAPASNIVAAYLAVPAAPMSGVSSFKVWRNDIPEPPNESGHGTFVNGRWQYVDKYHTPVTDEDGNIVRNEDGTVASYTYDPEA